MPIRSYVFDNASDQFIRDVDIILVDPVGIRQGVIATTDSEGEFEIEYPLPGYSVELSNTQYQPVTIKDTTGITWKGIGMDLKAGSVGGNVVVTGVRKKTVSKPNYILPIALGSAALITFGLWLHKSYG